MLAGEHRHGRRSELPRIVLTVAAFCLQATDGDADLRGPGTGTSQRLQDGNHDVHERGGYSGDFGC